MFNDLKISEPYNKMKLFVQELKSKTIKIKLLVIANVLFFCTPWCGKYKQSLL